MSPAVPLDQTSGVKIDVEGIEIKVLGGLEQTIARGKPNIFVEVDSANLGSFRYGSQENFMLVAKRSVTGQ